MEIHSHSSNLTIEIQAGQDVYLESAPANGGIHLGWNHLPYEARKELERLRAVILSALSKCAIIIDQNKDCTPLDNDGFPCVGYESGILSESDHSSM